MKKTGTDCYKVVTLDRESVCSNFGLFSHAFPNEEERKRMKDLLRKKRITKVYKKGSVVRAAKIAGPILCFDTYGNAKNWADTFVKEFKILSVRGFEKEKVQIMKFSFDCWRDFIINGTMSSFSSTINGCVGYRRIKVLT